MDRSSSEKIPMLKLDKISKSFYSPIAEISILKDADLDVQKGETIAVVGASGIGKSTLLHIIGTLDRPDSGQVLFHQENLLDDSDEKLAEFRNSRIGFVFQFHYLLQGFTALENVSMPGLVGSKNKKNVEKSALNMLERVGLAERATHRIEAMSGGEQQRVALARALVMKPDLLLADEPTGNLDRGNSRGVHDLITALNQEIGMTVIVVTHNDELARMMDRKVTLRDGKIVPA